MSLPMEMASWQHLWLWLLKIINSLFLIRLKKHINSVMTWILLLPPYSLETTKEKKSVPSGFWKRGNSLLSLPYRELLQGKQPQDVRPEKWELGCDFIFFACSEDFCNCCECCSWAAALHSSALLWTIPILFISFSSKVDLIFCIFTYRHKKAIRTIR